MNTVRFCFTGRDFNEVVRLSNDELTTMVQALKFGGKWIGGNWEWRGYKLAGEHTSNTWIVTYTRRYLLHPADDIWRIEILPYVDDEGQQAKMV